MKLESRKTKLRVSLAVILVCSFIGVAFYLSIEGLGTIFAGGGQTFLFVNPVFAQSVSSDTTFLEEEAGMAIYVNVGQSLDLSAAKTVYKTIEKETPDYVVGSLSLLNLPETEDVHCFAHKDGWIVVYYLKNEPISKIIDWSYYSPEAGLTKTKLQIGLEQMGNDLGVTVTDAKYYNFQYTFADKWMIIIESREDLGIDSFNIKIPSEFTVYERSWSHYAQYAGSNYRSYFQIDGSTISTITKVGETKCGQLTATQLNPDVFHTVSVGNPQYSDRSMVGIVFAYQES